MCSGKTDEPAHIDSIDQTSITTGQIEAKVYVLFLLLNHCRSNSIDKSKQSIISNTQEKNLRCEFVSDTCQSKRNKTSIDIG